MLNRILFRREQTQIAIISGLVAACSFLPGQLVLANVEPLSSPTIDNIWDKPFQSAKVKPVPDLLLHEPHQAQDPLNSAYPVPWSWILDTQAEFTEKQESGMRYYRTSALVSPDGQYAAYSRIQMQAGSQLYESRVTSVLFLEDLQTGKLRVIDAESPIIEHFATEQHNSETSGIVSILMPVSWSAQSDRLLSRQFEGFLSTSDATDYAVVWERQTNDTSTLSPASENYTTAILLGWSQEKPDQVLFRAGILGNESWQNWSVALDGQTAIANEENPLIYGEPLTRTWMGVQAFK